MQDARCRIKHESWIMHRVSFIVMKKNWELEKQNPRLVEKLAKSLGIKPVTAQVLINRGIRNEVEAEQFLNSSLFDLPSPYLLKDMDKAVDRIRGAIQRVEKIAIYGDYDVDGITSTAILYLFLKNLGANVIYYNPDRLKEGYGVNIDAIQKLKNEGVSLIISGDCGITAHAEVIEAKKLGIDFIITDHHEPPDVLPEAAAILNPHQQGCIYPGKEIAGVGVVFNLVVALRRSLRDSGFFESGEPNLGEYLDLVALGTVSDCASLRNVNRIFVKEGIKRLSNAKRLGIIALKEVSGTKSKVDTYDIGFRLGPRVNASGRLNSASLAVKLFISNDIKKARELASILNNENSKRQTIEGKIINDIISQVKASPTVLDMNALVFASSDWHQGVIGIVASKLVEMYQKPTVIISIQEEGIGKGSARSVEGINIYDALSKCNDLFEQFGGHELAAGLNIRVEKIDEFRNRFERAVNEALGDYTSKLRIDSALDLSGVTESLISELDLLSPFGIGNPEPVFIATSVDVASQRLLKDRHLGLKLNDNNRIYDAIWFNPKEPVTVPNKIDIVFTPEFNEWNGKKSIQLKVKDIDW
ncbi:MAG TPA: single-stranded-DNA-specific exonuclease RecJ [Thermodesulfobacteriota bacterium]